MGSKKGQTVGFRYYMSLLSGLCRGPIDELRMIKVDDEVAWDGHACSGETFFINSPDLFGGDKKEGGIQGPFKVFMGAADQVLPGADGAFGLPDVKASIGTGRVSDFRHVVTLWYDGLVSAMNPYLKTWKFRVRRSQKGWHGGVAWYERKATVYMGNDVLQIEDHGDAITSDSNSGQIVWSAHGLDTDTLTINGNKITYTTDPTMASEFVVLIGGDAASTAQRTLAVIQDHAASWGVQASGGGATLTLTAGSNSGAIHAMNGSHIIYECCTNPEWGRGLDPSFMDENSFIVAANQLCSENFGLCLPWYRKEDIDVFIQKVCDLIAATVYTDRETGLTCIRLIRDDYDVNDLPLFTPDSGLVAIQDDDSASGDEGFNEVIGTSTDPVSNLQFQVRAQNLAAFQSQQSVKSSDSDYTGIPTKNLLSRIVLRDIRANATGLKKYTIILDRRAWRLAPGMPFRISDPRRGILNMVLRAGEIDDGNMVNGEMKVKAAQDVYGLPATSYTTPALPTWNPPSKVAAPPADERLFELSYRDIYIEAGAGNAEGAPETVGYIGVLATSPSVLSYQYDLSTHAGGEDYSTKATGSFTGSAKLSAGIAPLDTAVTFTDMVSFDATNVGQALLIGDEMVELSALDPATGIATIVRGCVDTVPQAHATGALAWTIDDDLTSDNVAYDDGETVDAKVLTRTSSDLLKLEDATEMELVVAGRQARPYPPADVKVAGLSIYSALGEQNEPVLTWVERNRITEADHLLGHTEASVTPEVGTTYNIRIYKHDGVTLLRETTGIVALTWTYTSAMQTADNPDSTVIIELESEREGLASYQLYRFPVALQVGFGYGWGVGFGL